MILFSPEYIEFTIMGIVLLPGIIFAIYTNIKVKTAFSKYNQVISSKGITGAECAKRILQAQGITNVQINRSQDTELSDNYNPRTNTITLSANVYDGITISALGIAAHETGHAIQHAQEYTPIKIRKALGYASSFMSAIVWPIILVGIVLNFAYVGGIIGKAFLWAGVGFFGLSLLFSLITLPVELNASKRALNLLVQTDCLDQMEVKGAKKVLSAAAMTYVAALIVSILQLVRFILFFVVNSRDD